MLTIVGILTFTIRKNSILGLSEPEKADFFYIFVLMRIKNSCSAELSMKIFITLRPGCPCRCFLSPDV